MRKSWSVWGPLKRIANEFDCLTVWLKSLGLNKNILFAATGQFIGVMWRLRLRLRMAGQVMKQGLTLQNASATRTIPQIPETAGTIARHNRTNAIGVDTIRIIKPSGTWSDEHIAFFAVDEHIGKTGFMQDAII